MQGVAANPSLLIFLRRFVGSSQFLTSSNRVRSVRGRRSITQSKGIQLKALEPQNLLEQNLLGALEGSPIDRMSFYKTIVAPQTELFLVQPPPSLEAGSEMPIKTFTLDDRVWVPVYSSLRQLRAANTNLPYIGVRALPFIRQAQSQQKNLFLNARAPFAKELPHEELTAILDGTIFQPYVSQSERSALTLGEPTVPPTWVLETLKKLFVTRLSVQKAYLALYNNPEPKFLVAVDIPESEWENLIHDVSMVLRGNVVPGEAVDFIRLSTSTSDLQQYFDKYKPFYQA